MLLNYYSSFQHINANFLFRSCWRTDDFIIFWWSVVDSGNSKIKCKAYHKLNLQLGCIIVLLCVMIQALKARKPDELYRLVLQIWSYSLDICLMKKKINSSSDLQLNLKMYLLIFLTSPWFEMQYNPKMVVVGFFYIFSKINFIK